MCHYLWTIVQTSSIFVPYMYVSFPRCHGAELSNFPHGDHSLKSEIWTLLFVICSAACLEKVKISDSVHTHLENVGGLKLYENFEKATKVRE